MSNLAATLGQFSSIKHGCFDDIDAQAKQMSGYDQRYQQLSRGGFKGSFVTYSFGDELSINIEQTNRVLLQGGSTPPARHALCFIAAESTPVTLNGQVIGSDSAIYWDCGLGFEAHLSEQSTIWVIDIGGALLQSPRESKVPGGTVVSGEFVDATRRSIIAGIEHFTRNSSSARHRAAIDGYCDEVVSQVKTLISAESIGGLKRRIPREQRLRLFRRGRDYIHSHLDHGIKINDLCAAASASRRAVELAFLKTVHMTPFQYIRALQLNQIRRELLRSDVAPQPLGDVAARWGIWHWSRFSREYDEAFGELPSQTRQRHLGAGLSG